jgi:hypothetical protein
MLGHQGTGRDGGSEQNLDELGLGLEGADHKQSESWRGERQADGVGELTRSETPPWRGGARHRCGFQGRSGEGVGIGNRRQGDSQLGAE